MTLQQLALGFVTLHATLSVAAPINWEIQMEHFDKVYKSPPQCAQGTSDMECNNHRARALKRFQKEWEANAYWRDGRVVSNLEADKRVNSEPRK
jgi:hypothetical protein